MERMTYQNLIRTYARNVSQGFADADLSPEQRRLCTVLLNLASNPATAAVYYPPSDETRTAVVRGLADILWQARALVEAIGPSHGRSLDVAHERAVAILRGI